MSFFNPLLLWGALGAAFPLLIHLWGRRRPRRVLFPSLRLIRAGQQQQRSYSRLRELLLLLLRMCLIALLSLALAGPVVQSDLLAEALRPEQIVAVILDVSASMAYREHGQTTMQRAAAAADEIARHLPPGARLALFEADTHLRPLDEGAKSLSTLRPGWAPGNLLEAIGRSEAPELTDARTTVYLVTDMQETSLRGELPEPLSQPPVVVDVGSEKRANHAVTDLHPLSACPLRQSPLELEAQVSQWGPAPASGTLDLSLEVAGKPVPGRSVPAARGSEATVLRCRPEAAGEVLVTASLPSDGFAADDVYRSIQHVRDRLAVVVVPGAADPRFITLALNPGGEADTRIDRRIASTAEDLSKTDLLILARAPSAAEMQRVASFLRRGGGVVLFAGPGADYSQETLRGLLSTAVRVGDVVSAPVDEPFTLSDLDTSGPPLEPFASPRAGNLLDIAFRQHWSLPGADDARVLARFSDGSPAVVGTLDPDRHCLLVNSSLDDRWSNAPFTPAFVPLVHRLCHDAVGPLPVTWSDWFVGHLLHARVPPGAGPIATVKGPAGETYRAAAVSGYWVFVPERPGIYTATWREKQAVRSARFAVNISPLESDPTRVSADEIRRRLKAPQARVLSPEELARHLRSAAPTRVNLGLPGIIPAGRTTP